MTTSPVPNMAAPPGMCPGIAVLSGGGAGGDGIWNEQGIAVDRLPTTSSPWIPMTMSTRGARSSATTAKPSFLRLADRSC